MIRTTLHRWRNVINYPECGYKAAIEREQCDAFIDTAEPVQDELTKLIEDTFHLPCFEFVYDEHWDLGHGWSGDMPGTR